MVKSVLSVLVAACCLAACRNCPDPKLPILPVTEDQIVSGKNTGIPEVGLYWGQSVSYVLVGEAAKHFRFKPGREALTLFAAERYVPDEKTTEADGDRNVMKLIPSDRSVLEDVDVQTTDTTLTLTIKPNTKRWLAKATFFFDASGDTKPAPTGLDPSVGNWGPNR